MKSGADNNSEFTRAKNELRMSDLIIQQDLLPELIAK
jgi:hypothetical protein